MPDEGSVGSVCHCPDDRRRNRRLRPGRGFSGGSFSNGCAGTLNYTITDNASWLGVAPDSGSSTVDLDTITIDYDVAGLHRGVYNATITGSGNAFNNPQSIAVKVTVNSVKPDFDGDGDADQADFGHFQQCITGSAVPQELPACQDARLDGDDVGIGPVLRQR